MAERRIHGPQRVLGVNALSSTAYGNVGSSIYTRSAWSRPTRSA
jgi:APA family basic amino acid/polyamine antiporter